MSRSATGRRAGSSRSCVLRKPFGSATSYLHDARPHDVAIGVQTFVDSCLSCCENGRVITRENLRETRDRLIHVLEESLGDGRTGLREVTLEKIGEDLHVCASEL